MVELDMNPTLKLISRMKHLLALKSWGGQTINLRATLKDALTMIEAMPPSNHHCYRCGKFLPPSYILGDAAWHMMNAAPGAAGGNGLMVPVCNECDPIVLTLMRRQ